MKFEQIEITSNMTKEEQLRAYLSNRLVMDAINEHYKEDDLEEYYEYLKEYKMPFNKFNEISPVNSIFYKVETDNGIKYFVCNAGWYEGVCEFEAVTEREVKVVV